MSIRHRPKSNTRQTKNGNLSAAHAKEIRSILRSITAIRILNCVARGAMRLNQVRDGLRVNAVHAGALNRTVRRMRNNGWLNAKSNKRRGPYDYSLTPKGRKVLKMAKSALIATKTV